jgi:hypothetical protein
MRRKPDPDSILVNVGSDSTPDSLAGFSDIHVDADGNPFQYEGVLAERNGTVVVAELTIKAASGVTPTMLRSVPVASVVARAAPSLAVIAGAVAATDSSEAMRRAASSAAIATNSTATDKPRGGRPQLTDAFLEGIARDYLGIQMELRTGRGVIGELARRHHVQEATARVWIARATDREFLRPTTRGRAGRLAGPKLRAEGEK